MNMSDQIAAEVIRERTNHRDAYLRHRHPRAARVLRGLAARLDRSRLNHEPPKGPASTPALVGPSP